MELTGKQKRFLRAKAHHLTPIFQIGKNGVTKEVIEQIDHALDKRELFKITLLQNTSVTPKEAAEQLKEQLNCHIVQIIGKIIVLYRVAKKEKDRHVSKEVKQITSLA